MLTGSETGEELGSEDLVWLVAGISHLSPSLVLSLSLVLSPSLSPSPCVLLWRGRVTVKTVNCDFLIVTRQMVSMNESGDVDASDEVRVTGGPSWGEGNKMETCGKKQQLKIKINIIYSEGHVCIVAFANYCYSSCS